MTTSDERSLTSRDFPVHQPVLTRWTDNDMFGHLNNAVFYEFFDAAINGWIITSTGIDPLTTPGWVSSPSPAADTSPNCGSPIRSSLVWRWPGSDAPASGTGSASSKPLTGNRPAIPPHRRVGALGARVRRPGHPPARAHPRRHPLAARDGPRRGLNCRYARPMPIVSKTVEVEAPPSRSWRSSPTSSRIRCGTRRSRAAGCWPATTTAAQPAAARRAGPGPGGHLHHRGLLPEPEPDLHRAAAGRPLREAGAEVLGGADRPDVAC